MGRILIPKKIRLQSGIGPRDPVEFIFALDAFGIKLYKKTCVFCSETENLSQFENIYCCPKCHKELKEDFRCNTEDKELRLG